MELDWRGVIGRGWAWVRERASAPPGLIFIFFACLYVLTCQGRVNAYDGQSMFATTRALADHGSLAISSALGVPGRNGLYYSKYGIGQSLAELPLYLMGKLVGVVAGSKGAPVAELFAMLTNPLLMALTCALLFGCIRTLGYTLETSVRATLVLGTATSLWPYSKVDFSEPLLTCCLVGAGLCLLLAERAGARREQTRMFRLDLLAGVALAVAILTKYAAVIYLPVFVLYATLTLPRPISAVRWLKRQTALLGPVVVAGCCDLAINALRFGSPFITGYGAGDRPLTGSPTRAVWGLLVSPYRGLLFYDPILFVGMLCLPLLLWRRPREAVLPIGLFVVSLAVYGTYLAWDGGSGWGPRYMIPALPFLIWPLLSLGLFGPREDAAVSARHDVPVPKMSARLRSLGLRLSVALAATIQMLGVMVNPQINDFYWNGTAQSLVALKATLQASPLAMAIWTLPMSLRFSFTHTFPVHGYASADYPFGPPFPTAPGMPHALGAFYIQFFWWTLLPSSSLTFGVGLVALGTGMALALRGLRRRLREAKPVKPHVLLALGPSGGTSAL